MRRATFGMLLACFAFSSLATNCYGSARLRIDLGLDTGRSDSAMPGWVEWQIGEGAEVSRDFDGIGVTIRPRQGGGTAVAGDWFKSGLVHPNARMATDGVTVANERGPAAMEVEIVGLEPGKHTVVTYHNELHDGALGDVEVSMAGEEKSTRVSPSQRAEDNTAAATAYLEFEVKAGEPTLLHVVSTDPAVTKRVILNGLEVDGVDPRHKAILPTPLDRDLHVDGDTGQLELQWQSASSAVEHHVYLASDVDPKVSLAKLTEAELDSACFVGKTKRETFQVEAPKFNSLLHYVWRVDSIDAEGNVTRGDTWRFRVRQLAFPGAEGHGRFAIGGRGGRVMKVTNLNNSGPGSLREAVEAEGPRTVVFDVSGRIQLEDKLVIKNEFLTIAGQTAPGKGICISGYTFGAMGAHDLIIRYVRVRPGDVAGKTLDGMGLASTDHSIIDHCSISWTQDEAFSSRGAGNITLQRTLIAEALNIAGHAKYGEGKGHGYAASIGGDIGSFHHNLLAHCAGRNWSLAGALDKAGVHAGRLDIRNNVVYNWVHRTTDGGAKEVNFVNNYYKPGPATRVFHVLKPERNHHYGPQDYYVEGNIMEGHYGADEPLAGVVEPKDEPMHNFLVDEPFFESHVTPRSAEETYDNVLDDVGCNLPRQDDHDRRVIQETREGSTTYKGSISGLPGIPDSQDDVGGWEDYPEIRRPEDWDADGDGIPDAWEVKHSLDPHDPADGALDSNGNGYTNLEEYLHWLAAGYKLDRE